MFEGLGSPLNRPATQILSHEQCRVIHNAALDILWRTGVRVKHPEVVELLRSAGCPVEDDTLVRIPEALVKEALLYAPSRVTIYDRLGNRKMHLEGRNAYFGTHSGYPYIWDHKTNEHRPFYLSDAANLAKLYDALPNIDFTVTSGIVADVPIERAAWAVFKETVKNTTKPIVFSCATKEAFDVILQMAYEIAGSQENLRRKPFLLHYSEPISPLQHSYEGLAKVLACADAGIPIVYTPMLMLGATAPATDAGLLAICVAEELSGLVIVQLRRKGTPFVFGGVATMMDMATQICSYGAPELNRMCAALTDMAHFYHLPMYGTAGCSDSKLCDGQAIIEMTISLAASFLSGANLIHDVGLMQYAEAASFEALVAADLIIDLIRASWKPIEISEETLMVDLIDQIGPGGHFLDTEHTLKHFKDALYSSLLDRKRYERWLAEGRKSFEVRIKEQVEKILNEHKPTPLDERIAERLDSIANDAGK